MMIFRILIECSKGPSGPFLWFKDFKNLVDKFPGEPHYIVFAIK
jgi:hypothetical protein